VDPLALSTATLAAFLGNPVTQGVIGNRADATLVALAERLRRAGRSPGSTLQQDLAYAAWWACLQSAVAACNRILVEGGRAASDLFSPVAELSGSRDPAEAPVRAVRRRLLLEIRRLERQRSRYFVEWVGLVEDLESPELDAPAQDASGSEIAVALFRPWLDARIRELGDAGRLMSGALFDEHAEADFHAFLGDCIKRDAGVRAAYEAVALAGSPVGAALQIGAWPSSDEISDALADGVSRIRDDVADALQAVEDTIALQVGRMRSSQEELQTVAAALLDAERRRHESELLSVAAAGRNTRLLSEARLEELADAPLVGRAPILRELEQRLTCPKGGSIVVSASAGFGKSALLAHWIRDQARWFGHVAYHFVDSSRGVDTSLRSNLFGNLLAQMLPYFGAPLSPTVDAESQVGHLLDGSVAPVNPDERLIVAIDGLDEVLDWGVDGPMLLLRSGLPANVLVVATMRSAADDDSQPLRNWFHDEVIRLGPLTESDVAVIVARHPRRQAAELAGRESFVQQLTQITSGVPLYIQYALRAIGDSIEDEPGLTDAIDEAVTTSLNSAADLFGVFLRRHFSRMYEAITGLESSHAFRLLLYLVAAQAPLEQRDVNALGLDVFGLGDSRMMRWIETPASGVYALPHPFLGEALARALDGPQLDRARRELVSTAEDWRRVPTPFAARHLPVLRGSAELVSLASDHAFLQLQREMAVEDPLLPVRTLDEAIEVAISDGDATAAVRLSRLRIETVETLDSPASAIESGAPLSRLVALLQSVSIDYQSAWAAYVSLALPADATAEQTALRQWQAAASAESAGIRRTSNGDGLVEILARLLVRRRRFDDAAMLASTLHDERPRSVALARIATSVYGHGDAEAARQLARLAHDATGTLPPDMQSAWLAWVAECLHAGGLKKEARRAACEACRIVRDDRERSSYRATAAAKVAARVGEPETARETARLALKWASKESSGSFYEAFAAQALAEAGERERAVAVAERVVGRRSVGWETLSLAARALMQAGNVERGRQVGRLAFDRVRAVTDEDPDFVAMAFSSLAEDLREILPEESGQAVHDALAATRSSERSSIKVTRLRQLAQLLGERGNREEADRAYGEALEIASSFENRTRREFEYASLAVFAAKQGRLDDALALLKTVEGMQPKAGGLEGIARVLTSAGDDNEALAVAGQALHVARVREERHLRARLLGVFADALAAAGLPEAVTIAESVSADALGRVARRLATSGARDAAELAVERATAKLEAGDRRHSERVRRHIAETFAILGDADDALNAARSAAQVDGPFVLALVGRHLAARGNAVAARAALTESLDGVAEPGKEPKPDTASGLYMETEDQKHAVLVRAVAARAYSMLGDHERALHLWDEAMAFNPTLENIPFVEEDLLESWAATAVAAEAHEWAQEHVATMRHPARAAALSALSRALAETGALPAAAAVACRTAETEEVRDKLTCALASVEVAIDLAVSGESTRARELVEAALPVLRGGSNARDRWRSAGADEDRRAWLASAAVALAAAGDRRSAQGIAVEAVDGSVSLVPLRQANDSTAASLIAGLVRYGAEAEARVVAEAITDDWLRAEAAAALAKALASAGRHTDAIDVALRGLARIP
jgi:tetratricopeptide (TPR) repeat protein